MFLIILGSVFTVIYILLAIGALFTGLASNIVPVLGIFHAVVATIILWGFFFFLRAKKYLYKKLLFSGIGIVLALSVLLIVPLNPLIKKSIAVNTKVLMLNDEPIYSESRNLIGIRLQYKVRIPFPGLSVKALLTPLEANMNNELFNMHPLISFGDNLFPSTYESDYTSTGKGDVYSKNFYPSYLVRNRAKNKLCIIYPFNESTGKSDLETFDIFKKNTLAKTSYKISFSISMEEGPGGSPQVYEGLTTNTYSPKEFYESALKEGAQKEQYRDDGNVCD